MPPARKRAKRRIPPPTGCGSEHETESSDNRDPADAIPKATARARQRTAKAKAKAKAQPKAKKAAKAIPKGQRAGRAKARLRSTSSSSSDSSSSSETSTSGYAEVFGDRVQMSPRSMDLDSDTIPDLDVQLDMPSRPQLPPAPSPAPLPWQREVAVIPRMARTGKAAAKMLCRAKLRCTCHFEYAWLCPDRLP